jgi:lysine 2,3-aminomutase
MLVKVSKHLRELAEKSPAIRKQFFPSEKENECSKRAFSDPLLEEKNKKVKGLVHKYQKRVLIELSMNCLSFCRFCTRRREVSDVKKGLISSNDISRMAGYIKSQPGLNEVIFSGGDPLTVPDLLIESLNRFAKVPQIKIIRVHTRVPVSSPKSFNKKVLAALERINKQKTVYLSIHFEHPDELTEETIKVIKALRKTGVILLSQSVFLKGVNDSYEVLEELFSRLAELGVRPYYIYHCDLVKGVEHFIVPIKKEIEIMTKLRKGLSGIAYPFHIVDTPNGSGKIPVPLNFWKFDSSSFKDFNGKKIKMY